MTLGAGIAFGLGTKLGQRRSSRVGSGSVESVLDLNPIVDRLEIIEDRIARVEFRVPTPSGSLATDRGLVDLEGRLASQTAQMESLRREIRNIETKSSSEIVAFNRKLAEVEARLPEDIEANVTQRIRALEEKLQSEFRQTHTRTVDLFVQTIENKVVQRIAVLEKNLADHSNNISALREKTLTTDENLQRLLVAVEKLCTQTALAGGLGSAAAELPNTAALSNGHSSGDRHPVETPRPAEPLLPVPVLAGRERSSASLAVPLIAVSLSLLGLRFWR